MVLGNSSYKSKLMLNAAIMSYLFIASNICKGVNVLGVFVFVITTKLIDAT